MHTKATGSLFLGLAICQLSADSFQIKGDTTSEPVKLIESIRGADLYRSYCAVCHGSDAKGKGSMVPALKARHTDLTTLSKRNHGRYPFEMVRDTISGNKLSGLSHGTRKMPVWGPVFSQVARDRDLGLVRIDNLVRFLETLQEK
jgi:hypothetical protein